MSAEAVEITARGELASFTDPTDRAAALLAHHLVTHGDADDETWAQVSEDLAVDAIFEVSTIVGMYQLLAQQMRLFRVDAPPGPWT